MKREGDIVYYKKREIMRHINGVTGTLYDLQRFVNEMELELCDDALKIISYHLNKIAQALNTLKIEKMKREKRRQEEEDTS
jgi:beta-galactosidase GanA